MSIWTQSRNTCAHCCPANDDVGSYTRANRDQAPPSSQSYLKYRYMSDGFVKHTAAYLEAFVGVLNLITQAPSIVSA